MPFPINSFIVAPNSVSTFEYVYMSIFHALIKNMTQRPKNSVLLNASVSFFNFPPFPLINSINNTTAAPAAVAEIRNVSEKEVVFQRGLVALEAKTNASVEYAIIP